MAYFVILFNVGPSSPSSKTDNNLSNWSFISIISSRTSTNSWEWSVSSRSSILGGILMVKELLLSLEPFWIVFGSDKILPGKEIWLRLRVILGSVLLGFCSTLVVVLSVLLLFLSPSFLAGSKMHFYARLCTPLHSYCKCILPMHS